MTTAERGELSQLRRENRNTGGLPRERASDTSALTHERKAMFLIATNVPKR